MLTVNKDIYLEQRADSKILNNVTKYCTECYKELQENKLIYFDIKNYRYLCDLCACSISEELKTKQEHIVNDYNTKESLF